MSLSLSDLTMLDEEQIRAFLSDAGAPSPPSTASKEELVGLLSAALEGSATDASPPRRNSDAPSTTTDEEDPSVSSEPQKGVDGGDGSSGSSGGPSSARASDPSNAHSSSSPSSSTSQGKKTRRRQRRRPKKSKASTTPPVGDGAPSMDDDKGTVGGKSGKLDGSSLEDADAGLDQVEAQMEVAQMVLKRTDLDTRLSTALSMVEELPEVVAQYLEVANNARGKTPHAIAQKGAVVVRASTLLQHVLLLLAQCHWKTYALAISSSSTRKARDRALALTLQDPASNLLAALLRLQQALVHDYSTKASLLLLKVLRARGQGLDCLVAIREAQAKLSYRLSKSISSVHPSEAKQLDAALSKLRGGYEPVTGRWEVVQPPEGVDGRGYACAGQDKTTLYLFGGRVTDQSTRQGYRVSDTLWRIHLPSLSWEHLGGEVIESDGKAKSQGAAAEDAAALDGDKAGEDSGDDGDGPRKERVGGVAGSWPEAREAGALCVMKGSILLVGGETSGKQEDDQMDVWRYQMDTKTWTRIKPDGEIGPGPRAHFSSIWSPSDVGDGGTLYIAGGERSGVPLPLDVWALTVCGDVVKWDVVVPHGPEEGITGSRGLFWMCQGTLQLRYAGGTGGASVDAGAHRVSVSRGCWITDGGVVNAQSVCVPQPMCGSLCGAHSTTANTKVKTYAFGGRMPLRQPRLLQGGALAHVVMPETYSPHLLELRGSRWMLMERASVLEPSPLGVTGAAVASLPDGGALVVGGFRYVPARVALAQGPHAVLPVPQCVAAAARYIPSGKAS